MKTILKFSDAAVIALHAVDMMGKAPLRPHSASEIAAGLGVSYNHLSKIMQRLTKAGYVVPLRGPKGGFILAEKAGAASLGDIIEAIEGNLELSDCLMGSKVCGRNNCLFSELLMETNKRLEKALRQKISAFAKNR